jgi:hypothetical protein
LITDTDPVSFFGISNAESKDASPGESFSRKVPNSSMSVNSSIVCFYVGLLAMEVSNSFYKRKERKMRFQTVFCAFALLFLAAPMMQAIAAEVNIVIDGDFADWADVPVLVEDPDDVAEDNGDIKAIRVHSTEDTFYAMLTVYGTAAPQDTQRYYYHILIDADNSIDTGFNNSEYEGNATGLQNPIGADFYVQVGRRNGADDGIEVYFLTADSDETVAENFSWAAGGDSMEMAVPFGMFIAVEDIGDIFQVGQTIAVSAFQEGNANDWECDWIESAEHVIGVPAAVGPAGKLPVTWATLKQF